MGLWQSGKSPVNQTDVCFSFPTICKWSSWLITHVCGAAERAAMQCKREHHTAASQPLVLASLLELMLDRSNAGTKEITSRMETRWTRQILVHKKKERTLNLVLGGGGNSSRKDSQRIPYPGPHPPSPNSDALPETNPSMKMCSFLHEFRTFCNHSLFTPTQVW